MRKVLEIVAIIIAVSTTCAGLLFAYTNQAYFPKSDGVVLATKVDAMEPMLKEIRTDIKKILLRGQG